MRSSTLTRVLKMIMGLCNIYLIKMTLKLSLCVEHVHTFVYKEHNATVYIYTVMLTFATYVCHLQITESDLWSLPPESHLFVSGVRVIPELQTLANLRSKVQLQKLLEIVQTALWKLAHLVAFNKHYLPFVTTDVCSSHALRKTT